MWVSACGFVHIRVQVSTESSKDVGSLWVEVRGERELPVTGARNQA